MPGEADDSSTAEDQSAPAEPETEAEALVAGAFSEVVGTGELDRLDEFHSPTVDFYPSSDERLDFEGLEETNRMFLSAFPDMDVEIEETYTDHADDSLAVVRYTCSGTHAGTFKTIPPTDRTMSAQGICIGRVEDGRIEELSIVFDNRGMLEQLGLLY